MPLSLIFPVASVPETTYIAPPSPPNLVQMSVGEYIVAETKVGPLIPDHTTLLPSLKGVPLTSRMGMMLDCRKEVSFSAR